MSIKIPDSCYFSAYQTNNLNMIDPKNRLQFSYSPVTYRQFSEEYSFLNERKNCNKRLFLALPLALLNCVEVFFHTLNMLIEATQVKNISLQERLSARLFYIFRDLQEINGRIISIFDDVWGLYLVQRSEFEKKCYGHFLSQDSVYSKPSSKNIVDNQNNNKSELNSNQSSCNSSENNNVFGNRPKDKPNIKKIDVKEYPEESNWADEATELFKNGDLEKAFEVINKIFHNKAFKEDFIIKIAKKHFENGDFEKAFKVIGDVFYDKKGKEDFIIQIAQKHFQDGDLKKTHKVIGDVFYDKKTKEDLIIQIAKKHVEKGDLEKAFDVIGDVYDDKKTKDDLIIQIAKKHFEKGDLEKAFDVIHDHKDKKNKEAFIVKIAEKHFEVRDLEAAGRVISYIYDDKTSKEAFIVKIAEKHFEARNFEAAGRVIGYIYHDKMAKESFIAKLNKEIVKTADEHFVKSEFEMALNTIMITNDIDIKENYYLKVAQAYFEKGMIKNSIDAIDKIIHNTEIQESFLKKGADEYLLKNELDIVFNIFEKMSSKSSLKEAYLLKLLEAHYKTDNKQAIVKVINDFAKSKILRMLREAKIYLISRSCRNSFAAIYSALAEEFYSQIQISKGDFKPSIEWLKKNLIDREKEFIEITQSEKK